MEKIKENVNTKNSNLPISDVIGSKYIWLVKLNKDLLQNKYNLKKAGLYNGVIKNGIENTLLALKDYDM